MLVKELHIRAFRGIESLNLEFRPGVNVFIGDNGVGKSSILDCLTVLLCMYIKELKTLFEMHKKNRKNSTSSISANEGTSNIFLSNIVSNNINISSSSTINLQIQNSQNRSNDIKSGSDSSTVEIKVGYKKEDFLWSQTIRKTEGEPSIKNDKQYLGALVVEIIEPYSPQMNIPLVTYYPVNRAVLDIVLETSDTNQISQMEAFDESLTGAQAGFNAFFRWFRSLEDIENEERRDDFNYRDYRLEAVRNAIPHFLPGFTNLRVRRSPLRMTVVKQGVELIINQLSDGEKCLLAIVGDLARRLAIANPGLSDPLQGSGIVLIDEIELHLHPQWQRGIIPKLTSTFPNCQFILSTHSPQIISDVYPESIYVLQRTTQGLIASRPTSSFGRDSNQILEELMDVPDRPERFKQELQALFRLIDEGNLEAAKQLKTELEQQIGMDEPEFAKADVMIRRKEILGR
ncbi:AAA family ATPase [Alkalinema pantanalense CENA528]|uniref:AAA family ATPase n=1 Tax=Alkalinema pantanalense TaxID=1620705 RepID=UPI003D700051